MGNIVAQLFYALLGWLPTPLYVACVAVIALFFLFTTLHIVRFVLDLIPFL